MSIPRAESLPKKIKLIRDKYPSHIGTIYNLMYKKYGYNNSFCGYVEDKIKDEKECDDKYKKDCAQYGMMLMRSCDSYEKCYLSDNKDEITLEEAKNTYLFEPIQEEVTEMTLKEVQDELGIKNLIIQQVIKYCEMGFFPICKLQNGQYQTFTPFKDDDDNFSCSIPSYNLDTAKRAVTETWRDFNHIDEKQTPTEIIGFYHPEFKPFDVGDRVICKDYEDKLAVIAEYDLKDMNYKVKYDDTKYNSGWYLHSELEPYLGPLKEAQCPKESKPLEVTLEDIAKKFGVDKISIVS